METFLDFKVSKVYYPLLTILFNKWHWQVVVAVFLTGYKAILNYRYKQVGETTI
jgi:hypothetical protein